MLVECSALEAQPFDTFGDVVAAHDYVFDKYLECRKRHSALVEYERKRK